MPPSLPSISKLIDSTLKRARPIYWKLAGIAAIGILVSLPFSIYLLIHPDTFVSPVLQGHTLKFISILMTVILFSLLVQVWMKITLMRSILQKSTIKIFQGYKESLKLFPAYFWIYFLQMLILVPAIFCLVIPFIIIAVHVLFADWFMVTGEARGLEALAKSRELSRGIFWKTALRVFFPFVIIMVLSAAINISLSFHSIWNEDVTQVIITILQTVLSLLVTPLAVLCQYELFLALKKHGTKKDPKKQMEIYKIFTIIGATLFTLFMLFTLLVITLLSIFPPMQNSNGLMENSTYEQSEL